MQTGIYTVCYVAYMAFEIFFMLLVNRRLKTGATQNEQSEAFEHDCREVKSQGLSIWQPLHQDSETGDMTQTQRTKDTLHSASSWRFKSSFGHYRSSENTIASLGTACVCLIVLAINKTIRLEKLFDMFFVSWTAGKRFLIIYELTLTADVNQLKMVKPLTFLTKTGTSTK